MVSAPPVCYLLKRFVDCIYWWTATTIEVFRSSEYWGLPYSNSFEFRGCIVCWSKKLVTCILYLRHLKK